MYQVDIINNGIRTTIHNPLPDKKAAKLLSGLIKKEINAIPSFTFEMAANNPGLRIMNPYITHVEVKNVKTGKLDFEGRVLIPTPSMENSGEIRKKIVCEGIKAYLHDSRQPYLAEKHWEGDGERTGLEEFIDTILDNHNRQVESYKKIYRGIVNVTPFESSDDVTKGLNYQDTYECIEEKLVESFGGEFDVRRGTDGLLYLDYVEKFGGLKGTAIALGVNMQSMSQESDPTEMVTRLIPLGAKLKDGDTETEERLTIESVNDGKKYVIDEEAENVYGIHYATVTFDDVTVASALKSKGQQWLIVNNRIKQKNTVTALELGLIDKRYELLELYNSYPIENNLIGVDMSARVTSQTIDIISPEKSSMTFGDKSTLLSDYNINQEKSTGELAERVGTVEKNYELNKEMIKKAKPLIITLSNESHTIATDSSGNGGDFTDCKTTLQVYSGTEDVTNKAEYTVETSDGITGNFDMATHTYSVTALTEDNGYVDFMVSYNGTTVTKRFAVSKAKMGLAGGKGDPGEKGETGPSGTSVTVQSTATTYQLGSSGTTAPTGTWNTSVPTLTQGKYLWTRTVVTYSDGNSTTSYSISYIAVDGKAGTNGAAGVGIKSITEYYLASSSGSGVTIETSGWTTSVQTVTNSKRYLWNYEVVTLTDNSMMKTSPVIIGVYGNTGAAGSAGADGRGISSIAEYYAVSSSNTTAPTAWSTSVQTMTSANKYLWNYEKITYTDGTTSSTTPCVIGVYGDKGATGATGPAGKDGAAGVGIASISERYAVSSSNSTAPTSWQTTVPTMTTTNKYLWNYEIVTYTDGKTSETAKRVIGVYGNTGATGATGADGADGKGIKSVTNYYLATASASGVTTTTSGWTTTVQSVTASKKYLWNYEVITYTDDTTTSTSPCIIGAYGDKGATGPAGKGVSSITNYYLASASGSGVTTATSGWTTTVQTISTSKKYLWNYEVIAYTDNTTTTTTPVIIGTYGNTGNTGATGPTGNGISSITEYYAVSTSNGTAPTSWVTTVPTMTTTNKYLWNYEVITYTNGTTEETVKRVIGVYGNTGAAGRVYMLEASDTAIKKGADNALTPASIAFKSFYRNGTSASRTAYSGRFKIEESTDGNTFTTKYTSSSNESSKVYTPSSSNVNVIRCTMYAAGGTTNALDTQSVVVLTDVDNMTKTVFSPSTPTDTSVLWIDTSQAPPVAKRYNPSTVSWEIIGDTTDIVQKIYSDLYSQINQTTENIMIQVGERTYLKDEIDQKVSEISTSYTQDKDEFLFKFNQLSSTLQELSKSTEQTFNETVKYIRFIDGSIYIGVDGNPLVLKQTNDRISFLENGVEVAYISNRKMYITDLQVINSQTIGTFRWQVESNGSLSLV